MKIITDPRCTEYASPGNPEAPERISRTVEHLRAQSTFPITWIEPIEATESVILRAHTPELLARLEVQEDFDGDTPWFPNISIHARRSAGGAIAALNCGLAGEISFSLMRPPGHHTTRNRAMGFCYLNSIAIAVFEAQARGCKRIAVFDFDLHHGNGTEEILVDQPGALFVSVHQYPEYPWTGSDNRGTNCLNFPVPPHSPRETYVKALQSALDKIREFQPDLIAVSAGFDPFRKDPLSHQDLGPEDFHWLGESIRELDTKHFSILEGGYSSALPELVHAYLCGLNGK